MQLCQVTSDELPGFAAGLLADLIAGAAARHDGPVTVALSGGRSPLPTFRRLATRPLPWERIELHQVDERLVPRGHPERNLDGLRAALADHVPVRVVALPVDATDPEAAALAHDLAAPPRFDVVHLGLGEDGHTASLFPGDPALGRTDQKVVVTGPHRGLRRMTLTYPALDAARARIWIVTGPGKAPALRRLLDGDTSIPAGRVSATCTTVVTDVPLGAR